MKRAVFSLSIVLTHPTLAPASVVCHEDIPADSSLSKITIELNEESDGDYTFTRSDVHVRYPDNPFRTTIHGMDCRLSDSDSPGAIVGECEWGPPGNVALKLEENGDAEGVTILDRYYDEFIVLGRSFECERRP